MRKGKVPPGNCFPFIRIIPPMGCFLVRIIPLWVLRLHSVNMGSGSLRISASRVLGMRRSLLMWIQAWPVSINPVLNRDFMPLNYFSKLRIPRIHLGFREVLRWNPVLWYGNLPAGSPPETHSDIIFFQYFFQSIWQCNFYHYLCANVCIYWAFWVSGEFFSD